jgi:exodeoxyribonuclease V gamma subunit
MTEDNRGLVADVLPLDDVKSDAIDLAGRFAEYVERTRVAVDGLIDAKPLSGWVDAIASAADTLTATGEREAWQRRELGRILDEVFAQSNRDGQTSGTELELADVCALLADRLRGRPTRANFRTGHLTVCTLVPMRSVPHRVVCILGLDDGEFPRRAHRDGDDLLLRDPHVGDRDARAEDRQMLLDALLAATERLIITYTGNDERTNLRRPPAVPVGELLDVVERTVRWATEDPVRERILVRHPLQSFDPRNFTPGALIDQRPWGFDRHALAGAQAMTGPRRPAPPFLREPLKPTGDRVIELDRLVRFVERPIRALLRDRLGINVHESLDEVQDAIPVELDKLEEWGVGQRLLEGVLAGAELNVCVRIEQARGLLPPARLGVLVLERIRDAVRQIADHASEFRGDDPDTLDLSVALPDGRTLVGTVAGVCADTVRAASYSRVKPRDRIRAWVRLLALSAARPERRFESVVIGQARADAYNAAVTVSEIPALGADPEGRRTAALRHLATLIDLYDRGMREVLPLTSDASAAYAHAVAAGRDGSAAARTAWQSSYERDREDREPEHRIVFGEGADLEELMAEPPRPDERGDGAAEAETTRFGWYARHMWDGLLAVEVLRDR